MAAGTQFVDGRIPGQRIATTTETGDSPTFTTTETAVASVTASLVSGRTYRVRVMTNFESDAAGPRVAVRLREDTVSGTTMQNGNLIVESTSGLGYPIVLEAEYVAASTANKTFVVTGQRLAGSGNLNLNASANIPTLLYVDYISG